jgi:hypothetical protein
VRRRGWLAGILLLAGVACGRGAPSAELRLTTAPAGPDTRVTLVARTGLKVNARAAPALELPDGRIVRFGGARLTADSAYFAEPASVLLPGRHDRLHGRLRASVCREDEQVCRSLTIDL